MQTTNFNEYNLSKLMLGTVQFGLDYGVANQSGKPSYEKAKEIIKCAFDGGINCFDTAAAYGNSEEVLGKAFSELGIQNEVTVVTKIAPVNQPGFSCEDAEKSIETSLLTSLKNLKLDVLPICLFHREEDLKYIDILKKMKDKGLVKYIGVSADTGEGALDVVSNIKAEAIQFPHNLLDHRYTSRDIFNKTSAKKMAVFTRSTYLQGLLLMPENNIKEQLSEVIPVRRKLEQLAKDSGINMIEMSMRYVISNNAITSILVGVDSVDQMQENLRLFAQGPLSPDILSEIDQMVPDFSETIVRPCLWNG